MESVQLLRLISEKMEHADDGLIIIAQGRGEEVFKVPCCEKNHFTRVF